MIVAAIVAAVAIAAAFIGFGLSRDAEYQRQAHANTREYTAYTNQQIRQGCLPLSDDYQADCIAKRRHEHRGYQRDEQNLVAQRTSANWAYITGAAAIIGLGLSVVGVVLVWTTFRVTRQSNEISREVGQAQVRAYLSAATCHLFYKRDHFLSQCIVHNAGASPARHVTWHPTLTIFIPGSETFFRTIEAEKPGYNLYDDVPNGVPKELAAATFRSGFTPDELKVLRGGGELCFKIEGNVEGRDVFDQPIECEGQFMGWLGLAPVSNLEIAMTPVVKLKHGVREKA